ncbi:MAG: hypothetical protein AB7F86_19010 [Bdellovibrionales bacterium]
MLTSIQRLSSVTSICLMISACSTTPKAPEPAPEPVAAPSVSLQEMMDAAESKLRMIRGASDLGHEEKLFNPCTLGISNHGCDSRYLTVVHFQLVCRDSEGTISHVPETKPITSRNISWTLAGQKGHTATDVNGFGQIKLLTNRSARGKRLILRRGSQFVGLTASEVSKIVLPKNWCS